MSAVRGARRKPAPLPAGGVRPITAAALLRAAASHERSGRLADFAALCASADMAAIDDPEPHLRLGIALTRLGRFQEAVQALFAVLRRDPRSAAAFAQLGNVFQLLRMPEEARESFRNALAFGRSPVEMAAAILFTSLEAARWESLDDDAAALDDLVAAGTGQPLPFYALNLPWSRARQRATAQAQAARVFEAIEALPVRARHARGRPIRVGFLSSDFHDHATAFLIAELFERLDQDAFPASAYSYGIDDGTPMRKRIAAACRGGLVDAREMGDRALAQRIRGDGIDILVDLKGYTLYARNAVCAYRPAPVQVNFLGFPGTLGSAHYDYIIGDPVVTPLAHAEGYAEKIAQMPHCYQPNDRQRPRGGTPDRAALGLPADAPVLCCFNANYKITPPIFERWCGVLRRAGDAVLWLFEANPQARRNLLAEAQARGVDPGRIFWAEPLPLAAHIARIAAADLFLDTAPVNAHTTASDALWAGVPVLTMLGETFVARVAASLVGAAGLPELVARDLDAYEALAVELIRDRARLRELRARLDARRLECPLFDSARYAADFEALLARMIERHENGLAPEHLAAAG